MENTQKGFIPVMLTPFKDNGNIDFDTLSRLTEIYLEAGAKGLFANCLSSEMFELTDDERIDVIKHVIKVAGGSVPVVATGTFGGAVESQAEFVNKVHDTGTDAVILITSLLAEESEADAVFNERVFKLFDLTGNVPVGFYECPVPYKRLISPEQLSDFVATGRVIYHMIIVIGTLTIFLVGTLLAKFKNRNRINEEPAVNNELNYKSSLIK